MAAGRCLGGGGLVLALFLVSSPAAADESESQLELLRRIRDLETKVSVLTEASSRNSAAALRPFSQDPVSLAGNASNATVSCKGPITKEGQCCKGGVLTKEGECCLGDLTKDGMKCKLRFHDKLVAFFHAARKFAADHIGPHLLSDNMFFFSIFLVLQWHVRFHLGEWLYQSLYSRLSCGPKRRQVKPMMTLRRIGMNILILGIYYDDSLPGTLNAFTAHRPFSCSLWLVFFDTVVLYYLFMILGTFINPPTDPSSQREQMKEWSDPLDEGEDDGICPEKFEANNIYEDLTFKLRRASAIWIVQVFLVIFYIEELNANEDTKDLSNVDFIYWIVAVMFQMHGGEAQVGEAFNTKYWMHVLHMTSVKEYFQTLVSWSNERTASSSSIPLEPLIEREGKAMAQLVELNPSLEPEQCQELIRSIMAETDTVEILEELSKPGEEASEEGLLLQRRVEALLKNDDMRVKFLKKSLEYVGSLWHKVFWVIDMNFLFEWKFRCFMDFTVNSVARNIILYTVPIMVAVEGPLDFVKDLTAVMFITMLDNVDGDAKDVAEILAKIKYEVESTKHQRSTLDNIRLALGLDVRTESPPTEKCCLNIFEKEYIGGHAAKFDRLDDLAGEDWRNFRRKGIPADQDEMDSL